MSVATAIVLLFVLMLVLLVLGLPIAFVLGASAIILGFATMGIESVFLMVAAILNNMRTIILIAIPLFIFMGNMLQTSGLADDLYGAVQSWVGGLRGGLAIGTIVICTMFAAMTGVSAAATVTMGVVALPAMLSRGYSKHLVLGTVMGGGALGQLIQPSTMFILFGFMAPESVGRLFAGGILPGLILAGLFVTYISVMCTLRPSMGPVVPREERPTWAERFRSLKALALPVGLIAVVLGSIFTGFATPTEAAAVGAAGAIACSAIYRRLTLNSLREACHRTISLTSMVMWIAVGATAFTAVFAGAGGAHLIRSALLDIVGSPILVIVVMQAIIFILGMFMDPTGIILLCTPIFVPVVRELGFSTVWFGVLFLVNLEMAYLTPPYGMNLFYMKGIGVPGVEMSDIYKSALPFVVIQATVLVLLLAFPHLALWIPNLIYGLEA